MQEERQYRVKVKGFPYWNEGPFPTYGQAEECMNELLAEEVLTFFLKLQNTYIFVELDGCEIPNMSEETRKDVETFLYYQCHVTNSFFLLDIKLYRCPLEWIQEERCYYKKFVDKYGREYRVKDRPPGISLHDWRLQNEFASGVLFIKLQKSVLDRISKFTV